MKENPLIASHNRNKLQLNWNDRIQIYRKYVKYGKPVYKACQNKRYQCGARFGVIDTHFFSPTHPSMGKKMSLVSYKHKITTSANYINRIGTGYTSHDKELCLHYFKINQSNQTCTNAVMKCTGGGGRGVKKQFFPPKFSFSSVFALNKLKNTFCFRCYL